MQSPAHVPHAEAFASSFAMSALPGLEGPLPAGTSGFLAQVCAGSLWVARAGACLVPFHFGPFSVLVFGGPLVFFFRASFLASGPNR